MQSIKLIAKFRLNILPICPTILSILILLLMTACTFRSPFTRPKEMDGLPGAILHAEGDTIVPELHRTAREYLSQAEFSQAEAVYREIILQAPEEAAGYVGLGSSLLYQNSFQAAEEAYTQALERSPESVMARIGLGSTALNKNDPSTAERYYQEAVNLDPAAADAYYGLALAQKALSRYDEAVENLEIVIKLAPDSQMAGWAQELLDELVQK